MKTPWTCFKTGLAHVALFLLLACNRQSDPARVEEAHFAFMDGYWKLNQSGRNYTEWWTQNGRYREGYACEMVLGDTVFAEEMQIFHREDDGWILGVRMANENSGKTVFFKLTRAASGEAVFENPAHDFPKRIWYRQDGQDGLYALVDEGDAEGHKLEFRFVRTEKGAATVPAAPHGHP
jgi:hypothetical protein